MAIRPLNGWPRPGRKPKSGPEQIAGVLSEIESRLGQLRTGVDASDAEMAENNRTIEQLREKNEQIQVVRDRGNNMLNRLRSLLGLDEQGVLP